MKRFHKIYLEISNICNLRCSFCPGTKRTPKVMTQEEFSSLLPKLRPYSDFLYFHLMGEPLCHPDLEQFLQLAGEVGFKVILTTNGTLLAKKQEILLRAPALHKVNISLHSFEGDHQQAHESYIRNVAEFANKANQAGIIISLRLWNNGCDEGRNGTALNALKENIPGQWTENTRGYRIRDGLFLDVATTLSGARVRVKELNGKDLPDGRSMFTVRFEVKNVAELDSIRKKLMNIRDVVSSRRGQN